jgi:Domain of Unknown Function (DUF1080)
MLLHILTAALLATGWAGSAGAQPNRLSADERAAGRRLLFNGKDMSGWDDPRKKSPPGDAWTIEDGCLKARANPAITEDLFTSETFHDFELSFAWRISPAGNSGVKYRIEDHLFVLEEPGRRFEELVNQSLSHRRPDRPSKGQDYVIGFEYQVIDNSANSDAKSGPLHAAGAVYDIAPPERDVTRPVGRFNQARIVLRGNHVEHWLNGVKVAEADLGSEQAHAHIAKRWGQGSPVYELMAKQPKRDCPISLQNHGDEAWFRDIKIRRLD